MKLYIGNATRQNLDFQFWVGKTRSPRQITIRPGEQALIGGGEQGTDLTKDEVDYIIKQHLRYGILSAADAANTRAFAGYAYSVDAPLTTQRMTRLMYANQHALRRAGEETRKLAAVGATVAIENQQREAGIGPESPNLDITVEQQTGEDNSAQARDEGRAPVAEAFRVSRRGGGGGGSTKLKKRGKG